MKDIEKLIEELGQISSRPDDPALSTRDMVWASSALFQKISFGARYHFQSLDIGC